MAATSVSYAIVSPGVLLFPSRIAPAPRNRVTTVASPRRSFRPFVPPALIMPAVSRLSLIVIGTPCRGPLSSLRAAPDRQRKLLLSHDRSKAEPLHSASDLLARSLRYTRGPFAHEFSRNRITSAILVAGHFTALLTTSLAQGLFHPLLGCGRKSILGKCVGVVRYR